MQVEYVDHMGSDLSVVNAARVSFDKRSEWVQSESGPVLSAADTRLIKYLAKHKHWTPFAHTAITLRVSAPVPIRTQCFKHKVGFVENEESRRYIKTEPVVYVPDKWRSAPEKSKQGSGDEEVWCLGSGRLISEAYASVTQSALDTYQQVIEAGVCPEQARFFLPQGVEVNWIWTGNLASYARFYHLRTDPHAQKEVQVLATEVGALIAPLFPVSWSVLTKGVSVGN